MGTQSLYLKQTHVGNKIAHFCTHWVLFLEMRSWCVSEKVRWSPKHSCSSCLKKNVYSNIRNSLVLQIWVWLLFGSWYGRLHQSSGLEYWIWIWNPKIYVGRGSKESVTVCLSCLCWWGVCVSVIGAELIWKLLSWRNCSSFMLWICLHTNYRLVQHIVLGFLTIFYFFFFCRVASLRQSMQYYLMHANYFFNTISKVNCSKHTAIHCGIINWYRMCGGKAISQNH